MLLGTERMFANKVAGIRTYGLVAMGSCLFIVVSVHVSGVLGSGADPLRALSGIISGIGFLGAGIIIFKDKDSTISGITSAAGLWVSCGIGIAIGFNLIAIGVFATLVTLFMLSVVSIIERKIRKVADIGGMSV
jgi:putative Mg2+ transporter-C (MgtC) family protein